MLTVQLTIHVESCCEWLRYDVLSVNCLLTVFPGQFASLAHVWRPSQVRHIAEYSYTADKYQKDHGGS